MAHPQAEANLSAQETTMTNLLTKIWQDQRGQDMTEYALIGGLMATMVIAVVPEMMSIALHIVGVLQSVADVAMHAAGLE
jgi:Flp pilus assembly pilin Flp